MDAKSFSIKMATAQGDVVKAAEQIADHFGFTAEVDVIKSSVNAAKQPDLARIRQMEGIAALLNQVVESLKNDGPEQADDDDKMPAKSNRRK